MSNHTAVVGCPALHSMIRLRANSYVMGPLVPSDTVRRYQHVVGSAWANAATVLGGVLVTATRLVRGSPLEREVCVVVASGWSQHRVSAGVATNATVPTQASQAVQKSGLLPSRQHATIDLNGSTPPWWSAWTIAAANCGRSIYHIL